MRPKHVLNNWTVNSFSKRKILQVLKENITVQISYNVDNHQISSRQGPVVGFCRDNDELFNVKKG